MSCDRMESDGMRFLDGEMTPSEEEEFRKHMEGCPACRDSVEEFRSLGELTGSVKIKDPMDTFWEGYWKSIYRRVERRTAWILILVGAVLVLIYEGYRVFRDLGEITFEKIAVLVLLTGFILLLISVIRERVHQRRTDKYKDIVR